MADRKNSWSDMFFEAATGAQGAANGRKAAPASANVAASGVQNAQNAVRKTPVEKGGGFREASAESADILRRTGNEAQRALANSLRAVSEKNTANLNGTVVETADATSFVYENGENGGAKRRFELRISNDDLQTFNVQDCRPYREQDNALINTSRAVRRQKLFATWEQEGALEALASVYPFVPFPYQLKNVRIMLNRFEGKGVFGDQVGLGKTVEALMTAHAMFVSGAIRNALIVVPSNTRMGWIREITEKFPAPILELRNRSDCEGERMSFEQVKALIAADNKNNVKGNRVYIVTEKMLRDNFKDILEAEGERNRAAMLQQEMSFEEKKCLSEVRHILTTGAFGDETCEPEAVLGIHGYGETDLELVDTTLWSLTIPKCEEMKNILQAALVRYRTYAGRADMSEVREKIRQATEICRDLEDEIAEMSESVRRNALSEEDVFASGGIDLLIVDEVHSFYSGESGENNTDGETEKAIDFLAERVNKKYCILMSATPVRESLDNVFDLVRILGGIRTDGDREEERNRFFETFCRIKGDRSFALTRMVFDSDRRRSFFGVINNFFTRRRIGGVAEDMKGGFYEKGTDGAYIPFPRLPDAQQSWLKGYGERICAARKLMYLQEDKGVSEAQRLATEEYGCWLANKPAEGGEDTRRHTRAAVDAVLIDVANDNTRPVLVRKKAHGMADWRRRHKKGIAVLTDVQDAEVSSDVLVRILQDVDLALRGKQLPDVPARKGRLIGAVSAGERETFKNRLWSDAAVAYVSRGSNTDKATGKRETDIRGSLAKKLMALKGEGKALPLSFEGRKAGVLVISNKSRMEGELDEQDRKTLDVTERNYHQFMILDQGKQAGINLQQFHTLIFMQMDWQGRRLLEPVDIEQWIGRIHRTGQTKTCRIITVLTTFMEGHRPEQAFLQWYYEVLSDAAGLDLYGDTTPDIAFLQPVIVDALRAITAWKELPPLLLEIMTDCGVKGAPTSKEISGACAKMSLISSGERGKTKGYSFAELLEMYYYMGDSWRRLVRDLIRKLCADRRFGKPGATEGGEV